jgi:hypothetical protein
MRRAAIPDGDDSSPKLSITSAIYPLEVVCISAGSTSLATKDASRVRLATLQQ